MFFNSFRFEKKYNYKIAFCKNGQIYARKKLRNAKPDIETFI